MNILEEYNCLNKVNVQTYDGTVNRNLLKLPPQVVRLINQLVKRRNERLDPAALDCLLTLKIRDVDMNAEADVKNKKKLDEKHKKRIVNLSKREKKVRIAKYSLTTQICDQG